MRKRLRRVPLPDKGDEELPEQEVKRVEPLTGGALTKRPVWERPLRGAYARKRSLFQKLVLWKRYSLPASGGGLCRFATNRRQNS